MQEYDRLIRQSGKAGVNVRHHIRDTTLQLVLFCSLQSDLNEYNLALIFRMFDEELLKRLNLEAYSLDKDLVNVY